MPGRHHTNRPGRSGLGAAGLVLFAVSVVLAQPETSPQKQSPGARGTAALVPVVGHPVGSAVTPPVSELSRRAEPRASGGEFEIPRPRPLPDLMRAVRSAAGDGALQLGAPTPNMPAVATSFEGLSSQDNANVLGYRLYPPDTNGEVGPSHYVQIVNTLVRVYSKSGTPLTAPFKLSTLFSSLGGVCANTDRGDPIALYDQLANRWF